MSICRAIPAQVSRFRDCSQVRFARAGTGDAIITAYRGRVAVEVFYYPDEEQFSDRTLLADVAPSAIPADVSFIEFSDNLTLLTQGGVLYTFPLAEKSKSDEILIYDGACDQIFTARVEVLRDAVAGYHRPLIVRAQEGVDFGGVRFAWHGLNPFEFSFDPDDLRFALSFVQDGQVVYAYAGEWQSKSPNTLVMLAGNAFVAVRAIGLPDYHFS